MTRTRHCRRLRSRTCLLISSMLLPLLVTSPAPGQASSGIAQRVPWITSHVQGTPDPPEPYITRVAFPNQQFLEPLATGRLVGTPYLLILERGGKVFAISSDRSSSERHLVLDSERFSYGIAAHPDFKDNGFIYIMHVMDEEEVAEQTGSRVSRYTASRTAPFTVDLASEQVIIEWPRGGHNGGCLRFGPDGYLYIATGDGSGIADQLQTGQKLDDLLGSLLRIDVNRESEGRNYAIPSDNPFVERTRLHASTRPEIYSFGHRQVWKYSFDAATGNLWAGEIGQDLWEMVYLIKNGGNYGWSVREGSHPFRPDRPQFRIEIEDPIVEHSHNDFRSITGGFIYHGDDLPELTGNYIYGDFDTGKIWTFRYQKEKVRGHRELTDTAIRLVAFGEDHDGELYLIDYAGGQIHELIESPPVELPEADFPRRLSETGLFTSTRDLIPAAGVIPYDVNSALWSDGAQKYRFLAIPGTEQIDFDDVHYPQPAPGAPAGWRFPDGTVLVKTFAIELEKGNPASETRLETRILHHKKMDGPDNGYGAQVWRGYTYVWNRKQTDALLLGRDSLDRQLVIQDPDAPGGRRIQTWHFPSRAECTLCHTMSAKYVLGVNTLQMNRDFDYGGSVANQISTLGHIGMFSKPLEQKPNELPRLVSLDDPSATLDQRVRSYLHANCAHCHRKWGGGNAEFQLLAPLPLSETGMIDIKPGQGTFKLDQPRLIVPGAPERSLVYHRMNLLELGRMPHVASSVRHDQALQMVRQWIQQLSEKDIDEPTGFSGSQ